MTEVVRCDWALIGDGRLWHAFARNRGPQVRNALGETQLATSICGQGPGQWPWSGMRLTPACTACTEGTAQPMDGAPFTVVRVA